jgi:serine/threonine protein kinase
MVAPQVDENWNVKVADFGFARIKEENATMTRCGTPCWTGICSSLFFFFFFFALLCSKLTLEPRVPRVPAPEVIRGQKYSEKADVYSFAIVMWEVLTRKYPFQGRNFMGVSLDVMEGRRPPIPGDCPVVFSKIMRKAWQDTPEKRPAMSDILATLNHLIGDDASGVGA